MSAFSETFVKITRYVFKELLLPVPGKAFLLQVLVHTVIAIRKV